MRTTLPPARLGLTVVATVLLGLAMASPAFAGDAPDATTTTTPSGPVTMDVSAGLDGLVAVDAPLVVDVELGSQQLVVGTLELEFRGKTAVAVEVPAGGVKQYRLESPAAGRGALSYTVVLRDEAGDEVASYAGRARRPETEVVGVLGIDGIDTALRSARTTPLLDTPEVVRLDPDRLDARIAPIGYIVAGPGSITRLTDEARSTLEGWVRDGGRLLGDRADLAEIAEPAGGALLAGTGIAVTRLGNGELGVMSAAPEEVTSEEWSLVLRDTPGGLDIIDSSGMGLEAGLVVAASTGQEAAVPALPWLLTGILLFIVLVGPVNMLVLRAVGKPEWSWVTIPVLSLLFLGGFWFVGKAQVLDYTANHASVVVDDGRAMAVADTGLLVQVASAGEHVLALGEGWQALPAGTGDGAMAEGVVDDRTVVFELDDLGLGAARVRSPGDRVELDAEVTPGEEGLEVTVTNNTPWPLESWGVVVDGRGFGSRDPLGAGDTASVTVVGGRTATAEPAVVVPSMSTGEIDYEQARLLGAHLESNWPALEDDASYIFGVTADRVVEVDMDGNRTESPGTTLLVRRFDLADTDLVELGSVAPELLAVEGASSIERYGEEIYTYGADSIVLSYRVPQGIPGAAAVGATGGQFDAVEIWDWSGAGWVPFEWERSIDATRHVSAGGEMLLRASVEDTEQFVDAPVRMQQYALGWTA